jgi:hypothetical protein
MGEIIYWIVTSENKILKKYLLNESSAWMQGKLRGQIDDKDEMSNWYEELIGL